MQDVVLSPTDFVALVNQSLEFAYPIVTVEGELTDFRIAKNRWVYFSLKDEVSTVAFFGTVYQLPGPLENGLVVRASGSPRLHQKFGFAVNVVSLAPVGKGSIKKAADLLAAKLQLEGLFAPERKRSLPLFPVSIGLITAATSAAYADFVKILDERWGGVEVQLRDVYVQGDQASPQIVAAIEGFNQQAHQPEILVITRGGGSAEDLSAFNDERVVRAVAASRIPTLVAVGHENDESLAELAADKRASTPSNAAQMAVPDKKHELASIKITQEGLGRELLDMYARASESLARARQGLTSAIGDILDLELQRLNTSQRLAALFNPEAALRRGYALVRKGVKIVTSVAAVQPGDKLHIQLRDGRINVTSGEVTKG